MLVILELKKKIWFVSKFISHLCTPIYDYPSPGAVTWILPGSRFWMHAGLQKVYAGSRLCLFYRFALINMSTVTFNRLYGCLIVPKYSSFLSSRCSLAISSSRGFPFPGKACPGASSDCFKIKLFEVPTLPGQFQNSITHACTTIGIRWTASLLNSTPFCA